jgi:Transposase, Mutator family
MLEQMVELLVQLADLELGLEIDPIVVLRAQPVARPKRWTTCRAGSTPTVCASCDGRRDFAEARRVLAAWLAKWQATYPKRCGRVAEHIEGTLAFYRLPRQRRKPMKSTDLLERLTEEIKRRTHVVRIFPTPRAACG